MLLTGRHELTIDPKSRLSIPASIRGSMDPEKDGTRFYLVPGTREGTLRIFADRYFERYSEECHRALEPGRDRNEFETLFYAMASLLEVDKQGRVLLPQWLLTKVGIGKQVYITGARDHLVLWNKDEFDRFLERNWQMPDKLLEQALEKSRAVRGGNNGAV